MKNEVVIITGPTASGKTDLAIRLAKERNGEIISCDSMQIYTGMDIGTAKPGILERQGIVHHNFDIVSPDQNYSVAQFKVNTLSIIDDIIRRNKLPIVVGGTGLYIDSLLLNLEFKEQNDNQFIREKYEHLLNEKGKEYLHHLLLEKDPDAGRSIHANNVKRVIRTLEILETEKQSLEQYKKNAKKENDKYDYILFVLNPEREAVYKKIEKRIDLMLNHGLIQEVKEIFNHTKNKQATSLQAIGYKEVIWYLKGYITLTEMVRLLKRNSRRYAKRQYTWFRKYQQAYVIDIDNNYNLELIYHKILNILDKNSDF
ncbi:MAG: tRNA (adenosine(37)-N6)-dimethylallyltransferase MiaA [Clostridia bacterium]|nr:tRNA (adenosine(37)-N6)-dimethylallyltransferase MiaA [Clostridia bacterium]